MITVLDHYPSVDITCSNFHTLFLTDEKINLSFFVIPMIFDGCDKKKTGGRFGPKETMKAFIDVQLVSIVLQNDIKTSISHSFGGSRGKGLCGFRAPPKKIK